MIKEKQEHFCICGEGALDLISPSLKFFLYEYGKTFWLNYCKFTSISQSVIHRSENEPPMYSNTTFSVVIHNGIPIFFSVLCPPLNDLFNVV